MKPLRTMIDQTRSLLGPANPVPGDAVIGSWSDPRGQATYMEIIVSTPAECAWPDGYRARHRPPAAVIAVATTAIIAASLLPLWLRPSAATATTATAPPLRYILTGVSRPAAAAALPAARSVLLRLARVAASQSAGRPPRGADIGYVLTNEWSMSTAVAGGVARSTVIPQVDQTWSAPVAAHSPGQAQAGPPVRSLSLNPARLRAQLLHAFAYQYTNWPAAYHLIRIITDVSHQVVPAPLEAAFWQVLAGQRGMENMGTVTDRAGRVGDAVAFTDRQGTERLVLIISPSTGQLIGWEDMFLRNPGGLSIPSYPAVIGYVSFLSAGWTTNMTIPAR